MPCAYGTPWARATGPSTSSTTGARTASSGEGSASHLTAASTASWAGSSSIVTRNLANGTVAVTEAFSDAHDVSLCGVFEDESDASEVILVHHYAHASDVPAEYLPPSPFIDFPDDLPTDY